MSVLSFFRVRRLFTMSMFVRLTGRKGYTLCSFEQKSNSVVTENQIRQRHTPGESLESRRTVITKG